jgi:hypothetical protein
LLWEEAVEAIIEFVGVAATVALVASHASTNTALKSNLVEICMLTHTSASRSCASIREDSVLSVSLGDKQNLLLVLPGTEEQTFCQHCAAMSETL